VIGESELRVGSRVVARLQADIRLEIGELFVAVDELGRQYTLSAEPSVGIHLPEAPAPGEKRGEDFGPHAVGEFAGLPAMLGVTSVWMSVQLERDLRAADVNDDNPTAKEAFDKIIREAEAIAVDAYRRLRAWARVGGTQQFGVADETPRPRELKLFDLEAGAIFPIGLGGTASITMPGCSQELREGFATFEATAARVLAGDTPPLAEALLADASALPVEPGASDPLRHLLMCAIACEVKVKTRLAQPATPEKAALLDIIIANPREVVQSVPQLLHKACRAVTGHSLLEENPELHKAVERLFKRRNDIAHRGKLPSSQAGEPQPERTAASLFAWLDALDASS
jgi:hypothetical protein